MTKFILKKHFLFFSLLLSVLVGCSSNEDSITTVEEEPTLKFKKILYGTYAVEISYNDNGNATTIAYDSGSKTDLFYNDNNQLAQLSSYNYTYDNQGRVSNISTTESTCDFTYNSNNLIIAQHIIAYSASSPDKNDITIRRNYTYNNNNQLIEVTEIDNNRQNDNSVTKFSLTYNTLGQVRKLVEERSREDGTEFRTTEVKTLTYDNSKNPQRLFTDSLGFKGILFQDLFFSMSTSYYSNLGLGSWVYYRLEFVAKNNLLEATIIDNGGVQEKTYNETFTYQYDNDYPINGNRLITVDGIETKRTQFSWEYTTD